MADFVNAEPTKKFFVDMLTRDIELNDAILDLLDNCLDGIIREKKLEKLGSISDPIYNGYYAKLQLSESEFSIEDNCGGIPRDIAENYAFRMGRSNETPNEYEALPTVGVYGIGMKRAIFKIGKTASVLTKTRNEEYEIIIKEDWIKTKEWKFPINDSPSVHLSNSGTKITVSNIREEISVKWKSEVDGIDPVGITELIARIKHIYGLILEKGFKVYINDALIVPDKMSLLVSTEETGIRPYMYSAEKNDVKVNLIVGFYAPISNDDEENADDIDRKTIKAGWTVICNDRIILYKDRSHLTGWGESPVPNFHAQFIGITGIVIFESPKPQMLPITTTKRGIDHASALYSMVKERMKEGTHIFTQYTNRWKGRLHEEYAHSSKADSIDLVQIIEDPSKYHIHINQEVRNDRLEGKKYIPSLPQPLNFRDFAYIRFSKPISDIEKIRNYIFIDSAIPHSPSEVGEACFDKVLKDLTEGTH